MYVTLRTVYTVSGVIHRWDRGYSRPPMDVSQQLSRNGRGCSCWGPELTSVFPLILAAVQVRHCATRRRGRLSGAPQICPLSPDQKCGYLWNSWWLKGRCRLTGLSTAGKFFLLWWFLLYTCVVVLLRGDFFFKGVSKVSYSTEMYHDYLSRWGFSILDVYLQHADV